MFYYVKLRYLTNKSNKTTMLDVHSDVRSKLFMYHSDQNPTLAEPFLCVGFCYSVFVTDPCKFYVYILFINY